MQRGLSADVNFLINLSASSVFMNLWTAIMLRKLLTPPGTWLIYYSMSVLLSPGSCILPHLSYIFISLNFNLPLFLYVRTNGACPFLFLHRTTLSFRHRLLVLRMCPTRCACFMPFTRNTKEIIYNVTCNFFYT